MEGLFASHPWTLGGNELRLGLNLRELVLGIQPGTSLGSGNPLQVPRVREFGAIRCKPPFTVGRRVHAGGRDADKQHQEQKIEQATHFVPQDNISVRLALLRTNAG